jgi:hypothetical protein
MNIVLFSGEFFLQFWNKYVWKILEFFIFLGCKFDFFQMKRKIKKLAKLWQNFDNHKIWKIKTQGEKSKSRRLFSTLNPPPSSQTTKKQDLLTYYYTYLPTYIPTYLLTTWSVLVMPPSLGMSQTRVFVPMLYGWGHKELELRIHYQKAGDRACYGDGLAASGRAYACTDTRHHPAPHHPPQTGT